MPDVLDSMPLEDFPVDFRDVPSIIQPGIRGIRRVQDSMDVRIKHDVAQRGTTVERIEPDTGVFGHKKERIQAGAIGEFENLQLEYGAIEKNVYSDKRSIAVEDIEHARSDGGNYAIVAKRANEDAFADCVVVYSE